MAPPRQCTNKPDVVICGHPEDVELITFLAEGIVNEGMSVFFPEENTEVDVSQLIPKAKVFLVVLSEAALTLDNLKDDIALAYMANIAIFPASTKSYRKLNPFVDGGLKLMLSRIQWTFFLKPEHFDPNRTSLLSSIKEYVTVEFPASSGNRSEFNMLSGHIAAIKNNNPETEPEKDQQQPGELENEQNLIGDFWVRHFGSKTEASYSAFKDKFNSDYSERITSNFGTDKKKLFENLMYKDIFVLKQVISRNQYRKFIGEKTVDEKSKSPEKAGPDKGYPDAFYDRLGAYVSCSLATRKVLGMESTVRMTAIQQLGSFKTPPVVRQLKELTSDGDPNIQAVAALALAKTGINDEEIEDLLINLLSNKDRLVRESACLSLAHMQSVKAMKRILHAWRNDPISHVRQAAELALSRMGLDAAKEAMKVTKVLTQEVTALKEASKQSVKS